ncbi:hypothetical protein ACNQGB_13835 [Flavobacterium sp. XS1P32]|uniref:hypothetical protein n=1 Tax=unclassified Flavobacterium TaxID=196869 RepID=UPI003AAAD340
MKNKLKLYLTLWVVLFTFLNVNAQCEIIMKFFKDDVYTSKELVAFAEKNPQKAFDSWKVLSNEKASLAKNLEELNLVSKNLDEIGKAGGYLKWKSLQELVQRLTAPLKSTYDDILRSGGSVVENNGILKLLSKNGNEVAQITFGKILPNKYFDDVANSGATPIGQPTNGYQVFKKGDDLVVKRMPDKSAYSSSELTELTQHPNAHVLERHGHDVTDEALIKRANDGIAPDGSHIGNTMPYTKPPYSSKFENPQQLQKALNNTKPGTAAFNSAPITGSNTKVVYHTLTDGSTYGKGVPKDGQVFQQSTKVRAISASSIR